MCGICRVCGICVTEETVNELEGSRRGVEESRRRVEGE